MGSLETSSNSSRDSNISKCFSTSNLSGFSAYQEEFVQIKQSVLSPEKCRELQSCSSFPRENLEKFSLYEERIKNLTAQLQSALKQNEKYKNDIYNLEKKTELTFNDKIEKLLKQNSQLETNLEIANKQIERLLHNFNGKNHLDSVNVSHLERKILELEKINHELNQQTFAANSKIYNLNISKKETETELGSSKLELTDLKLELTAKVNCVSELKEKISEQHIQFESVLQNNSKLSHSYDLLSNELENVKKSEEWYKNQLYLCQKEKKVVLEEIAENKKSLAYQQEKLAKLNLEVNKWKCECAQIELRALKEKEDILKQIENIERGSKVAERVERVTPVSNNSDIERITNYYEATLSDLSNEVARIKLNFEEQQVNLADNNKKYADLLSKYLILQKDVRERESVIEELEISKKDLRAKFEKSVKLDEEKNQEIIRLKSLVSDLEIKLRAEVDEKEFIEQSVRAVKEQFKVFKQNYDLLKSEMHNKNQEILHLQSEKQELFMSNNWKTCELEKIKQKEAEIKSLQEQITSAMKKGNELQLQNFQLLQQVDSLNAAKRELTLKLKACEDVIRSTQENENVLTSEIKNHLHLDNFDNISIVEVLEYVCKLCRLQVHNAVDANKNIRHNKIDYVKALLIQIEKDFQFMRNKCESKCKEILELTKQMHRLKLGFGYKINRVKSRVSELKNKLEENLNLLNTLKLSGENQDGSKDIQHLQALLEVKIREQKEKEKKYESNYATLLRSVRNHMKGRHAAEKHNAYIQELHNTLSEEHNSLKLQLDVYIHKIKSLESVNEDYSKSIEKFKGKISVLENKLNASSQCQNCISLEAQLQDLIGKSNLKDDCLHTLRIENQDLSFKVKDFESLNKSNINLIDNVKKINEELSQTITKREKALQEERMILQEVQVALQEERENVSRLHLEREDLFKRIENVSEKNNYLIKELELTNSSLRRKAEEVKDLEKRLQIRCEDENDIQNLTDALKLQLKLYRSDIDTLKSDKFFLQRLCNDLKTALKIQVSQYKILKEYVGANFCEKDKGKQEFNSLPHTLSNFPSPSAKYDDTYIEKLLQENNILLQDKPLGDIQGCLNTLRNEIIVLQKQIVQKNAVPIDK